MSGRKRREENELHSPYTMSVCQKERREYFTSPLSEQSTKDHPQESNKAPSKNDPPLFADNLQESSFESKENTKSSLQQPQSVKEYLMHKFEPGEDERALSQVITEAINPKCKMMKDAVNSFLRNEEPSRSEHDVTQDIGVSSSTKPNENSKSRLRAGSGEGRMYATIPLP